MKAAQVIERAYALLGVKSLDEPLTGGELSYGLSALNALLDSWQADGLYVPYLTEFSQVVTGSPITIGTGQTLNTARPKFVRDTSFVRASNVDYPIQWLSEADFNAISTKAITGTFPQYGHYDSKYPTASIWLWPQPVASELHLVFDAVLPAFLDYTTDVPIDTGYARALQYSLAEELAPGLREPSQTLTRNAVNARRAIRINNARVPTLSLPKGLAQRRGWYGAY